MSLFATGYRGAILSDCGRYRYRLWRRWGDGPLACFVMLNSSTADAEKNDPTIRRCEGFARAWGRDGLDVVNLAAYRAADPSRLRDVIDPVGPDNWQHVMAAIAGAGVIVAAWGAGARVLGNRVAEMLYALRERDVMCLGVTAKGWPRHPLYVSAATPLEVYRRRSER